MHRLQAYIIMALIYFVIFFILYLPILFILKWRGIGFIRQFSFIALFWSGFLIIFATILFTWPISFTPEEHRLNLQPFEWLQMPDVRRALFDVVIPNILMFIPLAYFIPVVFKKMRTFKKTVFAAFCISFSVEFFQYFIGRGTNIDDLITNTIGAVIGYAFYKISDKLLHNTCCWKWFTGDNLHNANNLYCTEKLS